MNSHTTITVVIPVLGDTDYLAEILADFNADCQTSGVAPDEIVVVDGANDDNCADLCAEHDCVYLRTKPGRGHQLHKGAKIAGGSVIWFLHADVRPPLSALTLIRREVEDGAIGGYFRFQFSGETTWYKKLLAWLINTRTSLGVPYGDQGLFLCQAVYSKTGGFPDVPLFEEVPLVQSARRHGRFVEITAPIRVSPRRWERDGWFRRTVENRLLALGYMLGVSPQVLAGRYRPKC
jgi:rSAM/selenodomain-associated transferase 2